MLNRMLNPANMVTMVSEIDASAVVRLREDSRAATGRVPSYTAIVMRAAARMLKAHPEANRAIIGFPGFRKLVQFHTTDIGVAVEKSLPLLPGAAFAVPVGNTAEKSLLELTDELQALAHCTEEDNPAFRLYQRILKYVPPFLSYWLINMPAWIPALWVKHRGSAAWVNAPSRAGADTVTTTWPWPITFSFGIVKPRPFVVDGRLEVRSTMPVVMVFDRRIMGGGPASRLFAEFQRCLVEANVRLADPLPCDVVPLKTQAPVTAQRGPALQEACG